MSVPNGCRKSVCLFRIRGAARNALACAGLALALAFDAASQAHPPWTRIAQRASWAPDITWGPQPFGAKGASRLVEGGEGRLLLSVGDSLFVGSDGGRNWEDLLAGTWGQGMFMSHDRGETWHSWNAGLDDLHIEALLVPRRGWNDSVYALTPDGLYRLGAAPSGLASAAPHPGRAPGLVSRPVPGHNKAFRSGLHLETPSGTRYRPDGRRTALPGSKP